MCCTNSSATQTRWHPHESPDSTNEPDRSPVVCGILLGRVFWFTLEFGVAKEAGALRTYGAGLLSSFGEITNFRNADVRPFDTDAMGKFSDYEISTFQEVLFAAASFDDAEARLLRFFDELAAA